MEEAEVPLEQLHEHVHHHAEHGRERWISYARKRTFWFVRLVFGLVGTVLLCLGWVSH